MHRPLLFAVTLFGAAALGVGCGSTPTPEAAPTRRDADPDTASAPGRIAPRADSLRPRGDGSALLVPAARIADDRIAECSGLAYAGGWWWMHNDSGDGPYLFRSRSPWFQDAERVEVPGAKAVDWEELAALGDDVLVCDIGDNRRAREDLTIYRVRPTTSGVETVGVYPIAYPDGKHDAEGVWVWEGRVHIALKNREEEEHTVYRFDELREGVTNVPRRIGAVELPAGEQVTAADANADGQVALLTYSQILVWPADAVNGRPTHTTTLHARQCEALAWTESGLIFTNEQRDIFYVEGPLDTGLDPWIPSTDRVRLEPVPVGADGAPVRELLTDLPVRNLRDGESIKMGLARGRIVLSVTMGTDTGLIPTTETLGSSILLTFSTQPRLRVQPDDPQIAIVLAPVDKLGAVALNIGGEQSLVDVETITVSGAGENRSFSIDVEIPVRTLFPEGLPREFRMALVGNGLRDGDDEPLFGALDYFTLLRPYAWATITMD